MNAAGCRPDARHAEWATVWIFNFGFLILNVVLDIGGVPHALGSVAAGSLGSYISLRFAGVALAVGSLNPCLCYFAPHGA